MGAMKNMTPWERFSSDSNELQLPESDADLRWRFVVRFERTVTKHHVIKIAGTKYEMPLGYPDKKVLVYHWLLDGRYAVVHDGQFVEVQPADLVANARSHRAGRRVASSEDDDKDAKPLPPSAADLAFAKDFRPAVGPDGGCLETRSPKGE